MWALASNSWDSREDIGEKQMLSLSAVRVRRSL